MKKNEIENLKKIKKRLTKKELEEKRLKDMYPEVNAYNDIGLDAYELSMEDLYKERNVRKKR